MNEARKVMMIIVPARQYATILIEPREGTFDHPAPTIASELSSILGSTFISAAPMWRNHFNSALRQLLIERITVAGTIPDKSSGSSQGEDFIERSFDKWSAFAVGATLRFGDQRLQDRPLFVSKFVSSRHAHKLRHGGKS
jgi:hypothetical protein